MRLKRLLLATLTILLLEPASIAMAQETQPGDACLAGETGYFRRAGDDTPGPAITGQNFMFCDGANWIGFLHYDNPTDSVVFRAPASAPADATYGNSQWSLWLDETNDEFELKGKKSDGTVIAVTVGGGGTGLWTDNTTHISYQSAHIVKTGQTMTTAGFDGGMGTGMVWHPDKAAFRAGFVDNTRWDEANIGQYSAAFGLRSQASGASSFAIGDANLATGGQSFAGGITATASGDRAFAFGNNALAANTNAVALGQEAQASGNDSVALGQRARVANTGSYSFAFGMGSPAGAPPQVSGASSFGIFMGDQSGIDVTDANTMALLGGDFIVGSYQLDDTTTGSQDNRMFFDVSKGAFRAGKVDGTQWDDGSVGDGSIGLGTNVTASWHFDTAIGWYSTASGGRSTAIGSSSTASGEYAVAIGREATAAGDKSVSIGHTVVVTATGTHSLAFGLGTPSGAYPQVSGASSFGIFMGDQSGVDVSQASTMAIMGGSVGIGTTSPNVELDVIGDIEYTGTIADVSDRRLKDNIGPLNGQLSRVTALEPVSFIMKDDPEQQTEYGLIAQDVEPIFPALVTTSKDEMGTKGLNYMGLIAPMIAAIKEQQVQIDALSAQNKALLERIEKLEQK